MPCVDLIIIMIIISIAAVKTERKFLLYKDACVCVYARLSNTHFNCIVVYRNKTKMTSHAEPKECLKKFIFSTDNDAYEDDERLEIVIPEVSKIAIL